MNTFSKAVLASAFALAVPAAASAACPNYGVSGTPLSYDAQSVWIPQSVGVIAGGNLDLSTCGSVPGVGYVIEHPDFTMQYNSLNMGRALELRVVAGCDAILLVNTATAQWLYNDDANGTNPVIRIQNAPSGQYDIWVGTYGPSTCDARLEIESF